jgi:carboxypeptidase Taq
VNQIIERGEFHVIRQWLKEKVHVKVVAIEIILRVKGSLLPSGDLLMKQVTGESLNPSVFVEYLTQKYSKLYHL